MPEIRRSGQPLVSLGEGLGRQSRLPRTSRRRPAPRQSGGAARSPAAPRIPGSGRWSDGIAVRHSPAGPLLPRNRFRCIAIHRAGGHSRRPARTPKGSRSTRSGTVRSAAAPVPRCDQRAPWRGYSILSESWRHGPTSRTSRTTAQPPGWPTSSPAPSSRVDSAGQPVRVTSAGPSRNHPAPRSRIAANTLGLSIRGRHIHSTVPLAAISADTSQSDKNPYSAIGGNGLPRRVDRLDRRLPVSSSVIAHAPRQSRGELRPLSNVKAAALIPLGAITTCSVNSLRPTRGARNHPTRVMRGAVGRRHSGSLPAIHEPRIGPELATTASEW